MTGIVTKNPSDCQRRAGFVNYEKSYPCEPMRFARRLFPKAVPARRSGSQGCWYKPDESHATCWLRFCVLINVSSGSARWDRDSAESQWSAGWKRRARCGAHASDLRGDSVLFPARVLFRRAWGYATEGRIVPARRSGSQGCWYRPDEFRAARLLEFCVFINVFSGSARWAPDSHESAWAAGWKRARPMRGVRFGLAWQFGAVPRAGLVRARLGLRRSYLSFTLEGVGVTLGLLAPSPRKGDDPP